MNQCKSAKSLSFPIIKKWDEMAKAQLDENGMG
jgi:hypothetical protein